MTKCQKVEELKRLVARGEVLCAEILAMDWKIKKSVFQSIIDNAGKENVKRVFN